MKVAILTDTHAGIRNDHVPLADYQDRFYEEVFFPVCSERGVKTILHGGDFFDRRQHITIKTLDRLKATFLCLLEEYDMEMVLIVGNHDVLWRNSNYSNSPGHIFENISRIRVIVDPEDIHGVAMIPWIHRDNYETTMEFMKTTKSKFCLGHFEIQGFEMNRGQVAHTGLDRSIFDRFQLSMSGHFHTRSRQGDVLYLGNPFEFNWGDYNDPRGFHFFDTETGELEFVQNPESMFFRCEYTGTEEHDWTPYKPDTVKDKFIKVIVNDTDSPYEFDLWHKELLSHGPADLQVIESSISVDNYVEHDLDVERLAKSNIQLIEEYVNELEDENKVGIVEYMRGLYAEVLA